MCGRFALALSPEDIIDYFNIEAELVLTPRYNIAPSQPILVVRQNENPACEFALLRWGLIPSWMKEENFHSGWINARIESAHEKPAFRTSFKHRRCLIVASGFYEWKPLSCGKQPYYISKRDKTLMAMAGIWDRWQDKHGKIIESCAILTTEANSALKAIHERMPVILDKKYFSQWLDPNNQEAANLLTFSKPISASSVQAYPVGQQVNKPNHDAPDCITAVEQKE